MGLIDAMNDEDDTAKQSLSDFGIGDSGRHWFGRGFLAGLMIAAAVNGLSYFVLSDGIANLIGASRVEQEAIGFPLEVWRRGQGYGKFLVNFAAFFTNCGVGAVFAVITGTIAARSKDSLNQFVLDTVSKEVDTQSSGNSFQFSITSILVATSIVALFLGVAVNVSVDPKVLAAIFFAGPWVMVGLSMLPPRIDWQHRVVMMTIMAIVMMGGIFICWTPQAVAGILCLLAYIFFSKDK